MRIKALFYFVDLFEVIFISCVFLLVSHDMELHSDETQHK